jgi:hypothetical protein
MQAVIVTETLFPYMVTWSAGIGQRSWCGLSMQAVVLLKTLFPFMGIWPASI